MTSRKPQVLDALAREFVLGTMTRRARRRFGRMIDEDPQVASRVYAVEADLLPLAWSLEPVQPSDLVWRRIAQSAGLGGRPLQTTPAAPGSGRWPLAAAAMLVALIVSTYGWWQEWQQPPERVIETVTVLEPTDPSISVVADAAGTSLWVARIYPDLQRADLFVATNPDAQPNNDYELWVLRDDGVPISIGLLPKSGERELPLSANAIEALGRSEVLAVSLEPLGGSPGDVPTGPVLYTAALLAP